MHKVALIGAGHIGRIHGRNATQTPGLTLAAIVDQSSEAAQALSASLGAPVSDLETVLADPTITGIIVASSTATHLDYSIRGVQAGKAVFCEKPIDQDLDRARQAGDVLSKGKVFLAFNRRFDPNFEALKLRLDSGAVGSLETVQITSNDPSPPPISYVSVSGGLFKDMAIHDFDMARWLLGEEPTEVFAMGACLVDPAIGDAGDIDTARVLLRTASGKLCVIANSRRSGFGYDQRLEAYASAGMVRADNVHESTIQTWTEEGVASDRLKNFFTDRYAVAYQKEMAHFAEILAGKATPLIGYADGVAALALAEAANQSLKTGEMVRL